MGTWICLLRIVVNLIENYPEVDEVGFTFGNLSPDWDMPNAHWTGFSPPQEVTHFLRNGEGEDAIYDLGFYKRYLVDIDPRDDVELYSFRRATSFT